MSQGSTYPPLKVALLGAGGRGRGVLAAWIKLTGCTVTAVVDPSQESLEKTRQHRDLKGRLDSAEFVTDVDGWYKRADCDVVLINSWDPQHAENAIACFEAGLNVQVAKPMAQSTQEADAVYQAWRRSGRLGVVDMQIRTCDQMRHVRNLIHQGGIGRVRLINCIDYVGRGGVEFRKKRSRRRDMIRSWTLAKGVHFLDLLNMFAGSDPARVFSTGGLDVYGGNKPNDLTCDRCGDRDTCVFDGRKRLIGGIPYYNEKAGCVFSEETDITDNSVSVIEYDNGVRASYMECFFCPEYQTTYEIIGDRGAVFVRYAMDQNLYIEHRRLGTASVEKTNFYQPIGGGVITAHGGGDRTIVLQMAEALRNGQPMDPDIRDGRQAVALAETIDRSIESGRPELVPRLPDGDAKPSASPAVRAVASS